MSMISEHQVSSVVIISFLRYLIKKAKTVAEQSQNSINRDVCVCSKDIVDSSRLHAVDEGFVTIDAFISLKLTYGNALLNVYPGDFLDFLEELLAMSCCLDADRFKILIQKLSLVY